jgi:hypothetical protein
VVVIPSTAKGRGANYVKCLAGCMCWCTSVISVLGRLRQEDLEFKASVGYTVRPCLKNQKQKPRSVAHTCYPSYSGGRD